MDTALSVPFDDLGDLDSLIHRCTFLNSKQTELLEILKLRRELADLALVLSFIR